MRKHVDQIEQKNASMTIFFALVLLLLESLFFSMLETARIYEMRIHSRMLLQETMESACSDYVTFLWENYHILGIDSGYGMAEEAPDLFCERLETLAWENIYTMEGDRETSFFSLSPSGIDVTECGYLTDQSGEAFRRQAIKLAKEELTGSAAEQLWNKIMQIQEKQEKDYDRDSCVENGRHAMEKGRSAETEKEDQTGEKTSSEHEEKEPIAVSEENNPFFVFSQLGKNGLLHVVTGDGAVSEKACDFSRTVSRRKQNQGNAFPDIEREESSLLDPVFYLWYLETYFGSYIRPKEFGGLSYELEYIIAGKESDRENLEAIVERLIAMREPENLITIFSTPSMMEEAYGVALFLAGVSANPAIISLVQIAVIAVWAFVESIIDVRMLLHQEKVPFLKTVQEWRTDLRNLSLALAGDCKRSETDSGLTYSDYLSALLFLQKEGKQKLRPLDLMETAARQQPETQGLCLDAVICRFSVSAEYQGEPLFFSYMGMGLPNMKLYTCEVNGSMAY